MTINLDADFRGKKVILAVTGSIAAYKAVYFCRLLVKSGAEVKVVMSTAATDFVGPLSFSTLSQNDVFSDVSDGKQWNNHVELGLWADVMVIAPCTANTIAKLASGLCDSMLMATYLSARCPVCIAPAMDVDMWHHPTTQRNIDYLISIGIDVIPVGSGSLASGLTGEGRLAEPEEIMAYVGTRYFEDKTKKDLLGKRALVTAGPTFEPLDPVRFIGNWSSGQMGIALAEELYRRGADVQLVLGVTHLRPQDIGIEVHHVGTAKEMYEACIALWSTCDIGVMAAAVADYTPSQVASQKIKKAGDKLMIEMEKTRDIAASLGKQKSEGQVLVGFALETENEIENAKAKLQKKGFDFIVLNNPKVKGAGFNTPTNKVTLIDNSGQEQDLPLKSKNEVAKDVVNEVLKYL